MAGPSSFYTPGMGGNGTLTVNGQIVPMPMSNAFFPNMAIAPSYMGSGQPPPTIPMSYVGAGNGNGNMQAAAAAAADPWSPTNSPLWMAVIALVVGFLGLRYVHWRG